MQYPIVENEIENEVKEDEHRLHLWEPLEFEANKEYEYIPKSKLFQMCSNILYYGIAYPVLSLVNKFVLGLEIEGKENLEKVKDIGVITISNHVHILDCTMIGITNIPRKVYFASLESNFKIPVVNILIRLLNTIPIPNKRKNKERFVKTIDDILQSGKIVHFCPEGSLWPYYTKLRSSKKGAFEFAFRNQMPILPFVITFRKADKWYHIGKKKPCVTLNILEPEYINEKLEKKEAVLELKNRVYKKMNTYLD